MDLQKKTKGEINMKEEEFLVLVENLATSNEETTRKVVAALRSMIDKEPEKEDRSKQETVYNGPEKIEPTEPDTPHEYIELQDENGEWSEPKEPRGVSRKVKAIAAFSLTIIGVLVLWWQMGIIHF